MFTRVEGRARELADVELAGAEVDQQPVPESRRFQVSQQLSYVLGGEGFRHLYFDEKDPFDEHIDLVRSKRGTSAIRFALDSPMSTPP